MKADSGFIYRGLFEDRTVPPSPSSRPVEGVAIAGGTEILQGTDIRVGGESARFGVCEARWSLYPMGGSAVRLGRQVPYTIAAEILVDRAAISPRPKRRRSGSSATSCPTARRRPAREIAASDRRQRPAGGRGDPQDVARHRRHDRSRSLRLRAGIRQRRVPLRRRQGRPEGVRREAQAGLSKERRIDGISRRTSPPSASTNDSPCSQATTTRARSAYWRTAGSGRAGGVQKSALVAARWRPGSPTRWDRKARSWRSTSTLRDLDHLARRPNVEVRQHDIVAEPIGDASFDLVHTRLVIEHLPAPERLLEMLAKATRPGGLLVVECTDMLATAAADQSDPRSRSVRRVHGDVIRCRRVDEHVRLRLHAAAPAAVRRARLRRERKPSRRQGRARRRFQGARVRVAGGARHAVNPDRARTHDGGRDRRNILACLADPDFWFVANNVVAAWGRRPLT